MITYSPKKKIYFIYLLASLSRTRLEFSIFCSICDDITETICVVTTICKKVPNSQIILYQLFEIRNSEVCEFIFFFFFDGHITLLSYKIEYVSHMCLISFHHSHKLLVKLIRTVYKHIRFLAGWELKHTKTFFILITVNNTFIPKFLVDICMK